LDYGGYGLWIAYCQTYGFDAARRAGPRKAPHRLLGDLTYIALGLFFVYLFAIIDIYSGKVMGWHPSFSATVNPIGSEVLANTHAQPNF